MLQRIETSYTLDVIGDYVLEGIVHGKVDDTDYRDARQGWKRAYVMVSRPFRCRLMDTDLPATYPRGPSVRQR